ncbi:hypothetical protein Tco_0100705 [Tanacetum coccineum]
MRLFIRRGETVMERAATTASSLEVEQDSEQDSGNIIRTQSMATLNEPSPQGTGSCSGPRCQDTILGDAEAQTRFKTASKQSNDPPLLRVNTLESGEDRLKLKDMDEVFKDVEGDAEQVISAATYEVPIGDAVNTASAPVTTASVSVSTAEPINTASEVVTTAEPTTPLTTTTTVIEDEDLTVEISMTP